MHYKFYSTEDFIQDEFFQQWVFSPTEETDLYWKNFLSHYPLRRKDVEEATAFLMSIKKLDRHVPESVIQRIKDGLNTTIDELESASNQKENVGIAPKQSDRSTFRAIFYPVAASLVFAALFIGYFFLRGSEDRLSKGLAIEEQRTPKGKQQHILLEDGTHVWLNANSELKYSRNFSEKKSREVQLQGEAFFDVAENKEKPFIVRTSGLAIKALGTAFNVRSYAEDHVVETTLIHGRVSIAAGSKDSMAELTLLPNQQALFSKTSKTIALEEVVDPENYIGWKNGWMIFDNKPFSYIKETLERWYDVTLIMEDESSLSCTFSAKFKDKTLQEVLEIFRITESISYRIRGNQVFIEGKLCEYQKPN